MMARWKQLSDRYAALNQREKLLIAVATLVLVGFVGFSVWVDPGVSRSSRLRKQIEQQTAERATLQTQVATLKSQLRDPDTANRGALAEVQNRLAGIDEQIGRLDGVLVPPDRVPKLLQALLSRHRGLTLVSLQTLPPVPLIEPPSPKKDGKPADSAKVEPAPPPADGNIYRHGIEIRIAGSYADLLAYVAELENAPQRVIWERMALAVTAYPRSELTLTVYTLSLDAEWLVV
jgi:MSHA biogenesis protein MshJ